MPATSPASTAYVARKAGTDVLYQVLQGHLETFLARADAAERPIPGYVE